MPDGRFRLAMKAVLPRPVRRILRAGLHYAQRVARWPIILWQVRGATRADQWVLVRSAVAAPFLSFQALLDWQDPILLDDADVIVTNVGRFQLRQRSDDLWHVLPWREKGVFSAITTLLRPGDIFIDAGANIGVYTVLASRLVGPDGRVICVEMMPDTADRLEAHVGINGLSNVSIVRKALSNQSGQQVMAAVEVGKYGKASIADSEGESLLRIPVATTTLDDIAHGLATVRLMKMDIEGVELAALDGGKALLDRLTHLIYESWGIGRAGRHPVDTVLESTGFSLSAIDGNNWLASRVVDAA